MLHSSAPVQLPSPQTAGVIVVAVTVHPVVSKAHNPVQESVPEVNPLETQVSPPKADPSHCSPVSITPFPQFKVVMQLPEEHVCPEPQFVVETKSETLADRTYLEVFLVEENEAMSCTFNLQSLTPRSSIILQKNLSLENKNRKVVFEQLSGAQYELIVSCTDVQGNPHTEKEVLTFDLEQDIDILYPEGAVNSNGIVFRAHTDVGAECELRSTLDNSRIGFFERDDSGKEHFTRNITGFTEGSYLNDYKIVCQELLVGGPEGFHEDYFSFVVDFTGPETKIHLQESAREVVPTTSNWQEYFVEEVDVSFECLADGFGCGQTYYCLGENCPLTPNHPNYRLYQSPQKITSSSTLCYYSKDLGGNRGVPRCGEIKIEGFGFSLQQPFSYLFQNELWGISNQLEFVVEFLTKVPTTKCKFEVSPTFNYQNTPELRSVTGENNNYLLLHYLF